MKKLAIFAIAVLFSQSVLMAQETATEAVKNMGVGWNLGNTLDAYRQTVTDVTQNDFWGGQGVDSETYWGQKKTTKPLFEMMKKAGFEAIRVPVTWFNHMDKDGKVKAEWMARVHEVVDMVLETGLYCIINVHHDTGADGSSAYHWIKADMDIYNSTKDRYEYLWKQIAEEFKDYDQRLLFEGYNEMLDKYSSWCFASFNTSSKYDTTVAQSAYDAINSYAQSFVNTVRATGSNNAERNLIVSTYAAASGEGTWNSHLTDPLTKLNLPTDEVQNHIIFEVHTYPTIANYSLSAIKSIVDKFINGLNTNLVSKGAPVIVGEWGSSNVDAGDGKTDYDLHRTDLFRFADYFVKQTKANNIGTFYWMGLTDGIYRSYPAFHQADLAECISKAYNGDDFEGEFPEPVQPASVVVFEGSKALAWGDGITIDAPVIKNAGEKCEIELTYKLTSSNNDLQFFYGDWSEKPSVIVNNKTYAGDFNPGSVYGYSSGKECTTVFTFPKTSYDNASTKGLIIHGTGVTLTKAVVTDPDLVAGIHTPNTISNANVRKFVQNGRVVIERNGKKYTVGGQEIR